MPKTASTGKLREQAIVDHRLCARTAFFGRLEDEDDRAVKLAMLGEMSRRAEQHRGMSVVAASVHLAVVLRAMLEAVELLNRQRIHVGAQADRAMSVAAFQYADHARFAQPAMGFDTPRLQAFRDQISRRRFFVTEFGVSVDRSSEGLNFAVSGLDFGDQFHDGVMMRLCLAMRGIRSVRFRPAR